MTNAERQRIQELEQDISSYRSQLRHMQILDAMKRPRKRRPPTKRRIRAVKKPFAF